MPQFDLSSFIVQLVWLFFSFLTFYFLYTWRYLSPWAFLLKIHRNFLYYNNQLSTKKNAFALILSLAEINNISVESEPFLLSPIVLYIVSIFGIFSVVLLTIYVFSEDKTKEEICRNITTENIVNYIINYISLLSYIFFMRYSFGFLFNLTKETYNVASFKIFLFTCMISSLYVVYHIWKKEFHELVSKRILVFPILFYMSFILHLISLLVLPEGFEGVLHAFIFSFWWCISCICFLVFFLLAPPLVAPNIKKLTWKTFIPVDDPTFLKLKQFWKEDYPKGKAKQKFTPYWHTFLFGFSSYFTLERSVLQVPAYILKFIILIHMLSGNPYFFIGYFGVILCLTLLYSLKSVQDYFISIYGDTCLKNLGWNIPYEQILSTLKTAGAVIPALLTAGAGAQAVDHALRETDAEIIKKVAERLESEKIIENKYGPEGSKSLRDAFAKKDASATPISNFLREVGTNISKNTSVVISNSTSTPKTINEYEAKLNELMAKLEEQKAAISHKDNQDFVNKEIKEKVEEKN